MYMLDYLIVTPEFAVDLEICEILYSTTRETYSSFEETINILNRDTVPYILAMFC